MLRLIGAAVDNYKRPIGLLLQRPRLLLQRPRLLLQRLRLLLAPAATSVPRSTLAAYSLALARMGAGSSVSDRPSRTIGFPFTATSWTSEPFSA